MALGPGGELLPGPPGQPLDQVVGADFARAGGDLVVAGDGEDVAELPLLQRGAQVRVGAVDLVAGHPGGADSGVQGAADHAGGECGFRGEADAIGYPGGPAAGRVLGPGARDIQFPVDSRVSARGGVDEVDRDLRVFDPPGRAGVLPLHADRRGALLQVPGLVDDQHRVIVLQLLDDEAAEVVADRVGIPSGPRQQVLQAVRGRVSGVLGQRPAVLARQVRQQPEDQLPCPAAWFHPGKPSRDAAHQDLEQGLPAGRIYAVTCGHRLIFCLHTPMITGGRTRSRTGPDQQDHDLRLEY